MPTFNQLVRKGRQTSIKSTAPALLKELQFFKESNRFQFSAEERGLHRWLKTHQDQPNSALRKIARVHLSNGSEVTSYIVFFLSWRKIKDLLNNI